MRLSQRQLFSVGWLARGVIDALTASVSAPAPSTVCDIWKPHHANIDPIWIWTTTDLLSCKRWSEIVSHDREINNLFLYVVSVIIETGRTPRFLNDVYTGAKEAKFGITTSLLNFRLQPSIKNRLRQHWIDRCSPWHLCDITVNYRWHR